MTDLQPPAVALPPKDPVKKFQRDLNSGLMALVVLSVLADAEGDIYGYDLGKRLQQAREGEPHFNEGSLYPILRSLAASGWLSSRIVPSYGGPPRRYYRITDDGRAILARWRTVWTETRDFVDRFAVG